MYDKIFSHTFFLPASEVNAQREMPLSGLVTTIISTATAHANHLDIGFDKMISHGISWVLSRLTIDIEQMPSVGHTYIMQTWIESISRLFSERNFRLIDCESNETVARAHSTWMAINMESRRPGDLTPIFAHLSDITVTEPFGGVPGGKLQPLTEADAEFSYSFTVSDIDVNRHVTTRRYIDLITDARPLEWYEENALKRFEIAFKHEARYGDTAVVSSRLVSDGVGVDKNNSDDSYGDVQITVSGTPCCLARLCFRKRDNAHSFN